MKSVRDLGGANGNGKKGHVRRKHGTRVPGKCARQAKAEIQRQTIYGWMFQASQLVAQSSSVPFAFLKPASEEGPFGDCPYGTMITYSNFSVSSGLSLSPNRLPSHLLLSISVAHTKGRQISVLLQIEIRLN